MFGRRNSNKAQSRPLSYDTQIELIFPAALFCDPIIGPMLKQVGIEMEAKGNKIMLFTDVRTVAALNANQEIMEVIKKAGIGTVLYNWNSEKRTEFLFGELIAISKKYSGDYRALSLAIFDLHGFVSAGMQGQLDRSAFASPLPLLNDSEKFDLATALEFMMSPGQINKPKAPAHHKASLSFGRR